MGKENFFNEYFCTISYDTDSKLIVSKWRGKQSLEQIKFGLKKELECIREKKSTKILVDFLETTELWTNAAHIVENEWRPMAIESGVKKAAIVYPKDIIVKFTTLECEYANGLYRVKLFSSCKDAYDWLALG